MRILRIDTEMRGDALHAALDKLDAVALRDGIAGSDEEYRLAEHLAKKSFENKTNIARSLRYEFLLWLCGKRDIRSAMAMTGPTDDQREFIIVSFSDSGESDILAALRAEIRPLGLKKRATALELERISLSRVRN